MENIPVKKVDRYQEDIFILVENLKVSEGMKNFLFIVNHLVRPKEEKNIVVPYLNTIKKEPL